MKTISQILAPIEKLVGEKETGSGNNTSINKYWNDIGQPYCGYTIWYADRITGKPYVFEGCPNLSGCRAFGEWMTSKGWRLTDNKKAQKGDVAFYCEYESSENRWKYMHVFFVYEKINDTDYITLEGNSMVYSTIGEAKNASPDTGKYEGIGFKKRRMPTNNTWAIFRPIYGKEDTKPMTKKVYLSPSDQRKNTYAYGNTTEDVQCGKIAEACKIALERNGVEVKLGQYDTMENRCKESDMFGADLHVPIHTNACNGTVSGTRMFSYDLTGEGYKACKSIFARLAPITPGSSENIKASPGLYEVKNPSAPTAYIECDFHDVPEVAKWIIENTTLIGETIAKGICDYFGIKFKEETVVPKPTANILYRVQVGAFANKTYADAMLAKLRLAGFEGFIVTVNK